MILPVPGISDHVIAIVVWVGSVLLSCLMISVPLYPELLTAAMLGVVGLATANLVHARHVNFNAGAVFAQKVREVLADELRDNTARLDECARDVADVKEAQIAIAGQFRGRARP